MLSNYSTDKWNETEWQPEILHDFQHHLDSLSKNITILTMIFTILGNTLVLVATWRVRSLHQPNKYFVASLAVADLLVGVFVAPLWLHCFPDRMSCDELISSIHLCRFMIWIDTVTLTASIYTLTFISLDRYLKISKPFQYKLRMTTSTSLKVIFTIWFVSIAVATYAATPHSGSNGVFLTAEHCVMFKDTKAFYTFLAAGMFFLPTAVIVTTYILIFLVVYKRKKLLRNGELGQNLNDQNQQSAFLQDLKAIRVLLIVVGVFVLCWAPYFVWMLLIYYDPKFSESESSPHWYLIEIFRFIMITLPLFNSLCNPIIYAYLDKVYAEAFKQLFRQIVCRRNSTKRQSQSTPLRTLGRD